MNTTPDRSQSGRAGLIAAAIACLASLILVAWTFWPSGGGRADPSPSVANADTVALDASTPEAVDAQRLLEGSDASAFIERSMDDAELASLGLTPAEERRIAQLATERLRLFIAPTRESYLAHLESVLGPEAAASVSDEQIEKYLLYSGAFARAPIDFDGLVVRPRYVRGALSNPLDSGHTTYNRGHQPYTSIADPGDDETDVVDVLVPMVVASPIEPYTEGKVYLVLSFVRDPDLVGWRPWRHSVYDPANRIRVLPSPWM